LNTLPLPLQKQEQQFLTENTEYCFNQLSQFLPP